MGKLRASICVLGPLVGRCKRAVVALPGGDAIGSRPLDMHQSGLEKLGARTWIEHGCIVAEAEGLHGTQIWLDFPSMGATENILMAAVLANGTTVIDNAAREPEIVDLCLMLRPDGREDRGRGHVHAHRPRRDRAQARPSTASSATGSSAPRGGSPPS